ncbi:MAG: hypothetical protein MZV64_62885 [Ignavibacteriales bacterium]|nr:hypothetical protein [Ignavibacteriales bacterium]
MDWTSLHSTLKLIPSYQPASPLIICLRAGRTSPPCRRDWVCPYWMICPCSAWSHAWTKPRALTLPSRA